jgi:hypothetical protein
MTMSTQSHARLNLRVPDDLNAAIDAYVQAHRFEAATKTSVVEEALRAFLEPADERPDMFRAFNRIENRLFGLTKRVDLLGKVLFHWIGYYFLTWPDMSEQIKPLRQRRSREMRAKFLLSLRRRLDRKQMWDILDATQLDDMITELQEAVAGGIRDAEGGEDEEL